MAPYFLTHFNLFSRHHANINKSTINHEINIIWFTEKNRQNTKFNNELASTNQFYRKPSSKRSSKTTFFIHEETKETKLDFETER